MAGPDALTLSSPQRLAAVVVAVVAASPLVIASTLSPASAGVGTHTALGLPACSWQMSMGVPCPTCGMTTSFAHAARGDLLSSFLTQPAGFVLCILTAMVGLGAIYAALTGAPMHRVGMAAMRPAVMWSLLGIVLAGWIWKMVVS